MKKLSISVASVCLICLPLAMRGQADSAASVTNAMPSSNFGFSLPTHSGTLSYSLNGSELVNVGYGGNGTDYETVLSGNLAYLSGGAQDPFSLVYSGGYFLNAQSGRVYSSTYQDLSFSQVLRTRAWTYVVSDSASYLPQSPTTGLSGVAGVGDIGVPPVQTGIGPPQDILTNYSNRISNGLNGSATWQIGPRLELAGSASWDLIHFEGVKNPGIDSNSYSGEVGPSYQIDARSSAGANAYYSYSTYPDEGNFELETEGLSFTYDRAWSRSISTTFAFGPQITHGRTFTAIPSRVDLAGSASLTYATRTTGITASYSRGVNTGSGVIYGGLSDTASILLTRPISRDWQFSADGNYSRNQGLAEYMGVLPHYDAVFAAAQVSHRLTETLSCYGSYTVFHQLSNNDVGVNAFNGTGNVIGFGITYAPAPLISGR